MEGEAEGWRWNVHSVKMFSWKDRGEIELNMDDVVGKSEDTHMYIYIHLYDRT